MVELIIRNNSYSHESNKCFFYGAGKNDFGLIFLVMDASQVIYFCSFNPDETLTSQLLELKKYWPNAEFSEDNIQIAEIIDKMFDKHNSHKLEVKLTGTDFQVSVWKALANIKNGSTVCYEDIANTIGNPKAIRAVASAVKNNKIAYLIPCHRVISKNGGLGGFKWGAHIKMKLLAFEKSIL